jgi:hypothetical protein
MIKRKNVEQVAAYFTVLFQHLPGESEKANKNLNRNGRTKVSANHPTVAL